MQNSLPKRIAFGFLAALFAAGCNQPLDPRAPYVDRLVIYSVLSNDRNHQFVRVYSTYDAEAFDPLSVTDDRAVVGASVTISLENGPGFPGTDTLLTRPDISRYKTPLNAYVVPLSVTNGATYRLAVSAPAGAAFSSVRVPTRGYVSFGGQGVLQQPGGASESAEIPLYITFGNAEAFVARMTLIYGVSDGMTIVEKSFEVPLSFRAKSAETGNPLLDYGNPEYPLLRRIESNTGRVTYRNNAYLYALHSIDRIESGKSFTYRKALFTLLQAEAGFFKYYSLANGFQDSLSIRLDRPFFSNISGGVGLFGAYAIDTVSFTYPASFPFNR